MLSRRQGMNHDMDAIAYGGPCTPGRSVETKELEDVVGGQRPKHEPGRLDAVLEQRRPRERQAVNGEAQRIRVDQIAKGHGSVSQIRLGGG